MKNHKSFFLIILPLFFAMVACETTTEPVAANTTRSALTARTWYFFSVNGGNLNGGEGYDCVKQTNLTFREDGNLEINTYVRMPDYTCGGPYKTTAQWTLTDNKVSWDNQTYNIVKLTDDEFIKSTGDTDADYTWVYRK